MLTIAQITDLHVTTGRDPEDERRNAARLLATLRAIHDLRPRPAAIIASGDLVDTGTAEEYAVLASILASAEIPIYMTTGNHDRRAALLATFGAPQVLTDPNGFVQYAVDVEDLRLVICDTVDEGRDEGAFCEARATWLERTLTAAPMRPTIVVLHHPPIPSGIRWMDPPPDAPWIRRLGEVLAGHDQVLTVICGHVHRPYHGMLAGRLVSVSPATSLQLTLDMTPIDMRVADGREILVGEPPGFTLLRWAHQRLTTHTCVVGPFDESIRYNKPFQAD